MKDDDTAMAMESGRLFAKKILDEEAGGADPMTSVKEMIARMSEDGDGPPPMMRMCMGMCAEMLASIKRTTDMAEIATPEMQALFSDWLEMTEMRALDLLSRTGELDQDTLADELDISPESAAVILGHLARQGAVTLRATPAG